MHAPVGKADVALVMMLRRAEIGMRIGDEADGYIPWRILLEVFIRGISLSLLWDMHGFRCQHGISSSFKVSRA
jgi:hypothetical protein